MTDQHLARLRVQDETVQLGDWHPRCSRSVVGPLGLVDMVDARVATGHLCPSHPHFNNVVVAFGKVASVEETQKVLFQSLPWYIIATISNNTTPRFFLALFLLIS